MKHILIIATLLTSSLSIANSSAPISQLEKDTLKHSSPSRQAETIQNNPQIMKKGQIITDHSQLSAYRLTGEIIIQLAAFADAYRVADTYGLTLKQAYKDYYIVKSENDNLAEVLETLRQEGTVIAAEPARVNLGLEIN